MFRMGDVGSYNLRCAEVMAICCKTAGAISQNIGAHR